MGTYGRNGEFRVPPEPRERQGRYILDNGADVPQFSPVIVPTGPTPDASLTDAMPVELATDPQAPPLPGQGGIAIYEWIDLNGLDPVLNGHSDRDMVPDGRLCQVIRGEGVKLVLRNTSDRTYLHSRPYDGRVMVPGVGATPAVSEQDLLTPGAGDDTSGYWEVTTDPTEAWMIVELVDHDRGEIEARLLF